MAQVVIYSSNRVSVEGRYMKIARFALAALFLFAGISKLIGLETMQRVFGHFGYSQSFMLLIGVLETAGAIGLLVPELIAWAAAGLGGIMIGAIYSHLAYDPIYMALPALVVLMLLSTIAWQRQHAVHPSKTIRGSSASRVGHRSAHASFSRHALPSRRTR